MSQCGKRGKGKGNPGGTAGREIGPKLAAAKRNQIIAFAFADPTKKKTDPDGFETPIKTVRPSQQITSLTVKQAAFLRRTVVPQVPPLVALDRGSQELGKNIVLETKKSRGLAIDLFR